MTRILVLNGPNLGSLGRRQPDVYGSVTLADIETAIGDRARHLGVEVRFVQSNHEGTLVDVLEEEHDSSDGCIINPAALTHTSIALLDALLAYPRPVIEVHLSNIHAREPFRRRAVTTAAARAVIAGLGSQGYLLAFEGLLTLTAARAPSGAAR